ncbi:MAG: GNAT family N-acetyltransferase [Spirochaetaceae bacterium]
MRIETNRLIIVPPRIKDACGVYDHRSNVQSSIYTGGVTKFEKSVFIDIYIQKCEDFEKNSDNVYSIILKSSDEYIGYCGFQYCEILGGNEIMYGIDPKYWGNGYAYEAALEVLNFGLKVLKLDFILAAVNKKNIASEIILQKIGMKFDSKIEWPQQGLVDKYSIRGNYDKT